MPSEKLSFAGLPDCIKLSNGATDLIVTTSVGPRILYYGATGGKNHLGSFPDNAVKTALGTWKPYGGHRLWVWPELFPSSTNPMATTALPSMRPPTAPPSKNKSASPSPRVAPK
jgi:hypothetical protein